MSPVRGVVEKGCLKLAKTLGTENAVTVTLNSTFTTRTNLCPSVAVAGAKSPTKTLNGDETMLRFDLNWARSNIGCKVNLHLKDGSVIVNVLITKAFRSNNESSALYYTIPPRNKFGKVFLKEIAWAERLDSHLLMTSAVA